MINRVYQPGQNVNGILFLRDGTFGSHRKGIFECPFCKEEFETRISHVVSGGSTSCGCQYMGKQKHYQTTLAGYRSPTYKSWEAMMGRCYKEYDDHYPRYGAAGIIVHERWHDFNNFIADMGERPKGKTIDRFPNKKGNYEPGNCRWATNKQQQRNLSTNVKVAYKGETKLLVEWSEKLGFDYFRAWARLKAGVPAEMAFFEPKRSAKIIEFLKSKREGKSNFISHSFGHFKVA